MNIMALRYGDDIIVIDCGMMFPEAELLGVDIVTPDLTYLIENREHVRALFLTHGHEDHIGAVPYFLAEFDVPVYGTPFTLALVERRLEEHELPQQPRLKSVKAKQLVEAGPFKVEFIHVTHSTVDCVALAITTPLGVVIHTGDFKIDPTPLDNEPFDLHTLADYGKRGVLLLLSDSTNVDRPGYTESERAVRPRMEDVFNRAEKRVIVSCFSSSIHRMQTVLEISAEFGRKVALVGRSMISATEIAHSLGLLSVPDGLLIRPQDTMQTPPHKLTVLISGTQGEPMSALSRVAVDNHKHLDGAARRHRGDELAHHSRQREGHLPHDRPHVQARRRRALRLHESAAPRIRPRQRRGAHPDAEPGAAQVFRADSRRVPANGPAPETGRAPAALRPEGFFRPRNRRARSRSMRRARGKAERSPSAAICIDSGTIDEVVEDVVIRDRRHLSEDGIVLPIVAINKHTGRSETLPEVVTRGFSVAEDGSELIQACRMVVSKTLETSSPEEMGDWGVMKEKIRADLKRYIAKQTARRPLIMPVILEV